MVDPSGAAAAIRWDGPPDHDWLPAWSPDGRWLAFINGDLEDGSPRRLFIASSDLSSLRDVSAAQPLDCVVVDLAWAPDSRRVALGCGGERQSVAIMDVLDGTAASIDGGPPFSLAWTPDGAFLVGLGSADPGSGATTVTTANVATGEIVRIAAGGSLALSPDGRRILYSSRLDDVPAGRSPLFMIGLDGGNPDRLTEPLAGQTDGLDHQASWSPDGSRVIFVRQASRTDVLFEVAPGQDEHLFGDGRSPVPGGPNVVTWSPDGRWLLTDADGLTRVDAATGEQLVLDVPPSNNPGPNLTGRPAWQPVPA